MNNHPNVRTEGDKKVFVSKETGSVYWLEGDEIAFAPMSQDGSWDEEESGIVDEEAMRVEDLTSDKNYTALYKEIREALA